MFINKFIYYIKNKIFKGNIDNYVTCNLYGPDDNVKAYGLGNQLFCIATTLSYAWENDLKPFFVFNQFQEPYKKNIFRNLPIGNNKKYKIWKEPVFHYSKIPYKKNICLDGYFQSEKYFSKHRNKILDILDLPKNDYNFIEKTFGKLLSKNKTVSIHIRRGDYIDNQDHHPVCTMDYFHKAMNYFHSNVKYLIFSDNIKWAKEKFTGNQFFHITKNEIWDENGYGYDINKGGYPDYIEMYLMAMCNHNIISNSSFSWWGAWLNKNPHKKVIAPKIWLGPKYSNYNIKDIYGEDWIIL